MKLALLFLSFLLISCASSSPEVEDSERLAEATDSCLADPQLAKAWGDCNVKTTIYDRMDVIMACQTQHGSGKRDSIQFEIEVNAKGGVKKVGATNNLNKNLPLESCLKKEIEKMKFAAPPKGVKPVIQFPYRN